MMMMLRIFNTKILLRRRWQIGFFRGWSILDISGFPHSKPDSAASLKPRRNYEVFFSVSDPPAPVRYFILYRRVFEIQPTSSERAASLLRECRPFFKCCLSGTGRYRSFFLTFLT